MALKAPVNLPFPTLLVCLTLTLAPALAAQKADPACPQQAPESWLQAPADPDDPPLLNRVISIGRHHRRLEIQDGIVKLRTLGGTLLDQASFRGIQAAELRPLAGEHLGLLVLQTNEGSGSQQWDGYELFSVSSCWLTDAWRHPTLEIWSGPDSFQAVDTATIRIDHDSLRVVGLTFERIWTDGAASDALPDTPCHYDERWVWAPDSGRYVLAWHHEERGACAPAP